MVSSDPHFIDANLAQLHGVLSLYEIHKLNNLDIGHNEITKEGKKLINEWINEAEKPLNIRRVSMYNNKIESDQKTSLTDTYTVKKKID